MRLREIWSDSKYEIKSLIWGLVLLVSMTAVDTFYSFETALLLGIAFIVMEVTYIRYITKRSLLAMYQLTNLLAVAFEDEIEERGL